MIKSQHPKAYEDNFFIECYDELMEIAKIYKVSKQKDEMVFIAKTSRANVWLRLDKQPTSKGRSNILDKSERIECKFYKNKSSVKRYLLYSSDGIPLVRTGHKVHSTEIGQIPLPQESLKYFPFFLHELGNQEIQKSARQKIPLDIIERLSGTNQNYNTEKRSYRFGVSKTGEIYRFENSHDHYLLLDMKSEYAIWLKLYLSASEGYKAHQKRYEILFQSAPDGDETKAWYNKKPFKTNRTPLIVDATYVGEVNNAFYLDITASYKHSIEFHQLTLMTDKTDKHSMQNLDQPVQIEIQQIYNLFLKSPDILINPPTPDHLPFECCSFIFRDQDGNAIIIVAETVETKYEIQTFKRSDYEKLCQLAIQLFSENNITYYDYLPQGKFNHARSDTLNNTSRTIEVRPGENRHLSRSLEKSRHHAKRAKCIVRGHYRKYVDGRPLFGKSWGVGSYWIGPHQSGNPRYGIVIKDYRLDISELEKQVHQHQIVQTDI